MTDAATVVITEWLIDYEVVQPAKTCNTRHGQGLRWG